VLFNEPKLLKYIPSCGMIAAITVSVLFNEPKLLKLLLITEAYRDILKVSVLFNEPKLLKCVRNKTRLPVAVSFSALQRAEIAEIRSHFLFRTLNYGFSALQRAEIAEINRIAFLEREIHLQFQCSSTSRNC